MTITETIPTYVAITAAAVTIPASSDGLHLFGKHLVGIGLFMAERSRKGVWRFARRAHAIPAGTPESILLGWATSRLPNNATALGWGVDHALIPLFLDAAATAPPILACDFLRRIHELFGVAPVDMSLGHGGAGAPPLAGIAADMAIHAPSWSEDALTSAWATGDIDQLRRDLADEAMAIWRVFLRTAGVTGLDAEAATDAWVLRRQRVNAVTHIDSAA